MTTDPARLRTTVEQSAELLAVWQLDLLAQLENQLRAVHRTLQQIQKLRRPKEQADVEIVERRKKRGP